MAKKKAAPAMAPTREPAPGDQVQYVVIENPGQPTAVWEAEVTAVHGGDLVDLAVHGPDGYEGIARSVGHGRAFGCWMWPGEEMDES